MMTRVWDDECDVLVVGSGGGALIGAYVAASKGQKTLLIESTDRFGGTTAYSGSGMWLPCNAVLRRAGVTDTMDKARQYYHAVVGDRTPRALQDAYLDNGAPLVDYLEQNPWLKFEVFPWPDYFGHLPGATAGERHIITQALPASELGDQRATLRSPLAAERQDQPLGDMLVGGQALIARLLLALRDTGNADLRRNLALDALIVEDGTVIGAEAVATDGSRRRIKAARGVLLAAGGFEQNEAMRRRYGVPGEVSGTMGGPGSTGRAHEAAIGIGAAVDLMDQCWWSPGLLHPDGTATFSVGMLGGIFVDPTGERFVNESQAYDRLGRKALEADGAGKAHLPFWLIWDQRFGDRPPVLNASIALLEPAAYEKAGLWKSADTIEGLAKAIGVPPATLAATVARFNRFAATGVDEEFHRGEDAYDRFFVGGDVPEQNLVSIENPTFDAPTGGGPNPNLVAVDRPPFHAAAFSVSDLGTKGGLITDEHARVLRADASAIKGLYAAGNTMAAVSGTTYPGGGNPIGSSAVFAYLAVLDMIGEKG